MDARFLLLWVKKKKMKDVLHYHDADTTPYTGFFEIKIRSYDLFIFKIIMVSSLW